MGRHGMTQSDASRIQSSQARGGGDMSSGGFAARAQSAGDRNAAHGGWASGASGGSATSSQQGTAGGTAGQQKK